MAVSTTKRDRTGNALRRRQLRGACARREPWPEHRLPEGLRASCPTDITLADWGRQGRARRGEETRRYRSRRVSSRTDHARESWHRPPTRRPSTGAALRWCARKARGAWRSSRHRADGTKRTLSNTWRAVSGIAWCPSGDEVWFSGMRGRLARPERRHARRTRAHGDANAGQSEAARHQPRRLGALLPGSPSTTSR